MNGLLYSALVGSVVGAAGTGLGAVIALFIRRTGRKLPSILMSFSGGIMLSVVILDLMPEAYRFGGVAVSVLGMLLGAVFVILLEYILPHVDVTPDYGDKVQARTSRIMRTGVLIAMGIAIHNFPEGLAIGSGLVSSNHYGLALSLLIMMHDVPEGMAMAIPLRLGGVNKAMCVLYAVLAGMPTALGAFLGSLVGNIDASFIGGCMAFAGGAMIYITVKELIPESLELYRGSAVYVALLAGIAAGACMVYFI
jgi:ZIP family zinc transporter